MLRSSPVIILILSLTFSPTIFSSPAITNANGSTYTVTIIDYAFQPIHVNITTGTTVTWTYDTAGKTLHTVTSNPGTNQTMSGTPLINSGDLSPSQSFSYTFNRPGYYPYQCSLHPTIPEMNGWVMVTGNPITQPPPPPPTDGSAWALPGIGIAVVAVALMATWLIVRHRRPASA